MYTRAPYYFRPVNKRDHEWLIHNRNDFETWSNLGSPLPVWEHKQGDWLASLGEHQMFFLGFYGPGTVSPIGVLRLTDIDWVNRNACVGLYIFKSYRGKGYASGLFRILLEYCFLHLGLHRTWLLVLDTNNIASRVYEKNGFKREGVMRQHIFRNGEYQDYVLMGLLREEFDEIDGNQFYTSIPRVDE
jgi:RimJ/RimL family protein N-acetyltransferase